MIDAQKDNQTEPEIFQAFTRSSGSNTLPVLSKEIVEKNMSKSESQDNRMFQFTSVRNQYFSVIIGIYKLNVFNRR